MGSRFDYRCGSCGNTTEITARIGTSATVICPECGHAMERFFGKTTEVPVNYGYREGRYATQTDADIAKYQFQHL